MVTFEQNVTAVLPYSRVHYQAHRNWYGFSFQLEGGYEGRKIDFTTFVEKYEPWFTQVISRMDNGSGWIVNHNDKDMSWFPDDQDSLAALRTLFQQHHIPGSFKGAVILTKDDLLQYSRDLITYPFAVSGKENSLYCDLAISHGELPFVIRVSAHRNIDLLSTDITILKTFVNDPAEAPFIIRAYNGTTL